MKAALLNFVSVSAAVLLLTGITSAQSPKNRAILLSDLTWVEAERVLTSETVVVIPLGAAAKEHGPHLRLDNDLSLARYYTNRVLKEADVIIAPTITYHFYPAFLEYPGSTHLRFETARDMVVDIVKSLAAYGPRRFYILNTGVSTLRPLKVSAELLAKEGILMTYTDPLTAEGDAGKGILKQERGTHADESETSMMLYMYPDRVNMKLAAKDDSPNQPGGLTRNKDRQGTYSATGIWGDATLATRAKGKVLVEATLKTILREIEDLRQAPLPKN
jgi:creatinine amidohydrolase